MIILFNKSDKTAAFCGNVRKFAAKIVFLAMKTTFRTLCGLLLAAMAMASCLSDDDDNSAVYDDVAIMQVTMGTLNRYTQTTSTSTGNDTVLKTTVTGSYYPLTIDQLTRQIYNQKELPLGTDVKHVVLSAASAKDGGVIALQSMTSDSLQWLSTSDSIDFSVPRTLRVFSSNGKYWRDYTMTLHVSKTTGVTFEWKKVAQVSTPDLSASKLLAWHDSVQLVPCGVVVRGTDAYRLGDEGLVEMSQDLIKWQRAVGMHYENPDLQCLLGAGTAELYGLSTDGSLKCSSDRWGAVWTDEQLDDSPSLLPDGHMAMVSWPYTPVDNTDYVLLLGSNSRQYDGYVSVWRKLAQYGDAETGGQWVYMPADDVNHYRLPLIAYPSLVYYEGIVLCVGNDLVVRQSSDQGISWQTSTTYALPSTLTATQVSMEADAQGRLWLLSDRGELWQGSKR